MTCCEWLTIRGWPALLRSSGALEACLEAFSDCVAEAEGATSDFDLSLATFFFLGAFR
jgi:hypothetical protein